MATPAVPAVPTSNVQLQSQVAELRLDLKEANREVKTLKERGKEIANEYAGKMRRFVREDLPQIAIFGGGGAVFGALVGYWLFDQAVAYFGPTSYVGLLSTAAAGVVLLIATPSLVRVSAKQMASTAPVAAAAYGASIGLLGAGLYRAYQNWPAKK